MTSTHFLTLIYSSAGVYSMEVNKAYTLSGGVGCRAWVRVLRCSCAACVSW